MYRFPWYLTLVSTNHASSNPGQFFIANTVFEMPTSTHALLPRSQRSLRYESESGYVSVTCGRGNFLIRKEKVAVQKYLDKCGRGLSFL